MQPPPPPPSYGPPGGPPGPPGGPGWTPPPGGPGFGPGGPRRPSNAPAIIIIAVVAVLGVIGGGVLLFSGGGDDDPPIRPLAATPTFSDRPTPPTYSPPTFSPPTQDPTTPRYTPPERHYGAIAVGSNGAVGKAWDYSTLSGARSRAMNECKGTNCKVLTTFVNGCGAVAFNSGTNKYWGGHGSTRSIAQRNAISNAGGGRTITWVCTTR